MVHFKRKIFQQLMKASVYTAHAALVVFRKWDNVQSSVCFFPNLILDFESKTGKGFSHKKDEKK